MSEEHPENDIIRDIDDTRKGDLLVLADGNMFEALDIDDTGPRRRLLIRILDHETWVDGDDITLAIRQKGNDDEPNPTGLRLDREGNLWQFAPRTATLLRRDGYWIAPITIRLDTSHARTALRLRHGPFFPYMQ